MKNPIVNAVNLAEATELEFLYLRDVDYSGKKKLAWNLVVKDAVQTWKRHSVRKDFPISNLKVSVHSQKSFEKDAEVKQILAENKIKLEFSALPRDYFILVGKKRGNTTNVPSTDNFG